MVGVASAICAASIVGAIELRGVPRVAATVLAVLTGLYLAWCFVMGVLLLGVISVLARKPSVVQRAARVLIATAIGALAGTDTYSVGVGGLLDGPVLIMLVVVVLRTAPDVSPRARRIGLEMSVIAAIAALAVGLTIFL
jgi:hypothetical protein